MREIIVEMRKCFLRFDFYSAGLLFIGIVSFFIYQICTEGSVITINGATENLTFNELLIGLLQMTNGLGLTGILLAILSWRTLGKELDQKSIFLYILHAKSKWRIFIAKFITLLFAFIIILFAALIVSLLIFFITEPAHIELFLSTAALKNMFSILFLIIASSAVSILLACLLAIRFGTLGVLASTIGLSIFSALFQSNTTLKNWLPIHLVQLENTNFFYNLSILGVYICVLLISLKYVTKYRELQV